jgi:Mlc titration factor MtfA (ptsG expression regulator)
MQVFLILLIAGVILILYVLSAGARRRARLRKFTQRPFPEEWIQILERNLPPYIKLSAEQREELHKDVNVFLADKSFEGCGGQTITDEIRVTIAAQACMLLMGREDDCYPRLRSIVVYPTAYVTGRKGLLGGETDSESVRLGESWGRGTVVLSWSDVKRGAYNFKDGHNVTMHEFAHQLDQEDGTADGAPILEERSAYSSWARVFSEEFETLQKKSKKGKRSVLRSYGATNPAEFFAVATESFFEKPGQLKERHPELYDELQKYYKVDPAKWE